MDHGLISDADSWGFCFVGNSLLNLNVSFLSLQVYTWLHFISSDPGAEISDMWRLWVCVCPERLPALPHVSCMCRDPAQTELGAGALHHSVSHHEVIIAPYCGGASAPRALKHHFILYFYPTNSSHLFCLLSSMFLLVIATAYLEAQSIWEPFKRRVSVESNSTLETGRPFNLREIVQIHSDSK